MDGTLRAPSDGRGCCDSDDHALAEAQGRATPDSHMGSDK